MAHLAQIVIAWCPLRGELSHEKLLHVSYGIVPYEGELLHESYGMKVIVIIIVIIIKGSGEHPKTPHVMKVMKVIVMVIA